MIGGAGDDFLNGGTGNDTADHRRSGTFGGVIVDLGAGTSMDAPGTGDFGSDTLVSIERAIGSYGADTITGTAGANTLEGSKGKDTLTGGDAPTR